MLLEKRLEDLEEAVVVIGYDSLEKSLYLIKFFGAFLTFLVASCYLHFLRL